MTAFEIVVALLLALIVVLLLFLLFAKSRVDFAPLEKALERSERTLREEAAKNREESSGAAQRVREELLRTLTGLGERVQTELGEVRGQSLQGAKHVRDEVERALKAFTEELSKRLVTLTASNEERMKSLQAAVEHKLVALQEDNSKKLEAMRQTVDEKLQSTLEKRLGESFKQVSERLSDVHKGLGEMQTLAKGVGDLKSVLTNVKTRGTWGEVQLGALLEQVLTRDQYEHNFAAKEGLERVEYAVRMPGRGAEDDPLWLPIDAKFPQEDYQRLVEAEERSDRAGADEASKQLERRVKEFAWQIRDKYVNPPRTTDFALLFLPTEGLYAEILRRPGLSEVLQREARVVLVGPTTLWALLNSLQMGFRTLAIQKRSSEVWNLLGEVKQEFESYGEVLAKVKKKLDDASQTLDHDVARRARVINRRLRGVESLGDAAPPILPGLPAADEPPDA